MPQPVSVWLTSTRERWGKFSRLQQIAAIIGGAMALVLIIGLIFWSQQTTYSVLFSNLQTQDSAAIIAKLKANKTPYQLADNGNAILVPAALVDETRLQLAGDGLPNQGTVGFELFDKTNPLGMTDFTQQLDYQRALQGELVRTIQQINGVNQAYVTIVLPQSSLYTSTQADSTASITLRMNGGTTLNVNQVKAVMHLVASAVQGLKTQNVTVVDTAGNNLSDMVNNASLGNGINPATYGSALDVERTYEAQLDQQVMSMLSAVLGPNKVVVRVNANLNWDQIQSDSTTYTQPGQIAQQTNNNTTSNSPNSSATTGIPGTGTNLVPTPTAVATSTAGNAYTQIQNSTVYDVSQTVQHLTKAPGTVQRLTVAVLLDGQYPPATLTQIQQATANALGIDVARGDQIAVSALPFDKSAANSNLAALAAQQQRDQQAQLLRGIALAFVALALLVFALRATRRRKSTVAPATVTLVDESFNSLNALPSGIKEATNNEDSGIVVSTKNNNALENNPQFQLSAAEQQQQISLKRELSDLAKTHPELLAGVIVGWFDE